MALSKFVGSTTQAATNTTVQVTGLGFQPEVIKFVWNLATADGGVADSSTGIGFWCRNGGSPTQHGAWHVSDDNNTDSLMNGRATASDCIVITDPSGTILGLADVSASDSDSFTLNWTSVDGTQRIINFIALGGDIRGKSGAATRPTTTGNQAITGAGAQPTALVIVNAGDRVTALDTNSASGQGITLGWGTSSSARGVSGWGGRSARTTGDGVVYQRTTLITAAMANGMAAEADLVSLDADGFTLNWTTVNVRAGYYIWLALWGTDVEFEVGSFNTTTATGDQTVTTTINPELVILQTVQRAASVSSSSENDYVIGAAASTTQRFTVYAGGDTGAVTTNESSALDRDEVLRFYDEGGASPTMTAEADLVSFGTGQFVINWADASPGAYQVLYLAIKGAAGGGATIGGPILQGRAMTPGRILGGSVLQ